MTQPMLAHAVHLCAPGDGLPDDADAGVGPAQGFTYYADPVVDSVQPEAGPRWGSFPMTVFLQQDVLAMPGSQVCLSSPGSSVSISLSPSPSPCHL